MSPQPLQSRSTRTRIGVCAAASVLAIASAPTLGAEVTVRYVDPEHFTDASLSLPYTRGSEPGDVQRQLAAYFKQVADRTLPPDASLTLDILDIDLAGRLQPNPNVQGGLRIAREADWPRIRLHYSLSQDGHVVQGGDDTMTDMNYLNDVNRHTDGDPLGFEKAMIDKWFARRFGEH